MSVCKLGNQEKLVRDLYQMVQCPPEAPVNLIRSPCKIARKKVFVFCHFEVKYADHTEVSRESEYATWTEAGRPHIPMAKSLSNLVQPKKRKR